MVMLAIINRKSVRQYTDQEVSDDIIKKILEAGRLAPSWVNVQSWHFIVVKNRETKELLSEASGGQKQVKDASAVICCIADMNAWDKKAFSKVMEKQGKNLVTREYILNSPMLNPALTGEYETLIRTVEELTYAVAYMTLEAEELGIGACIVGAVTNEVTNRNDENVIAKVKSKLGLNDKQILLTMLTLGYEKDPKETVKSRKEFNEVVSFEKIGNKYE